MSLHTDGYVVYRNACPVQEGDVKVLMSRFLSGRVTIIMNADIEGMSDVGDSKRQQKSLERLKNKRLSALVENLKETAKRLAPEHEARDWVVLLSERGCAEQPAHADYQPTPHLRRCSDARFGANRTATPARPS